MPRKKQQPQREKPAKMQGFIAGAGEIVQQDISDTLRQNFMPYAMSVIMSRAIPEIDGFKPSHRKLLYTMYKMGLLGSARTKSANIVGQTMKLNPHGDAAIYDTMVRLSRGYEALLHPYVDSKGNFGKFYSRDMAWAASRYTEARLDPICRELFQDIDKDTVDFVDNYDSTMKEPTLLPATFPSVLVNANTGIAVGMASNICPFNLAGGVPHHHRPDPGPPGGPVRHHAGPGLPRRRPDPLRPGADGEGLRDRPGQLSGAQPLFLRQGPELHRRDPDPAHHHH